MDIAAGTCPPLALLLAAQWRNGRTTLMTERHPGAWAAQPVVGSLLQGGHDGHPTFCLVLCEHLRSHLRHLTDDPAYGSGSMSTT